MLKNDKTVSSKSGRWPLQTAKTEFSELVRRAKTAGPQHVTIHGRDEVLVIAVDEFRWLNGSLTGQALIEALQSSLSPEIDLEPSGMPMPVRGIEL